MEKKLESSADHRALAILERAAERIDHPSLGPRVRRDLADLRRVLGNPELELDSSEIVRMANDLVNAGLNARNEGRWDWLRQVEEETRLRVDWILRCLGKGRTDPSAEPPRLRLVK